MVLGKVDKNQLGSVVTEFGTLPLRSPVFAKNSVGVTNSRSLKVLGQVSSILKKRRPALERDGGLMNGVVT